MGRKLPSPTVSFGLFVLAVFLTPLISVVLSVTTTLDLASLLSKPLGILLPIVALVLLLRLDARQTLRIRAPEAWDLCLAVPLALSLAVINDQISNLVGQVIPLDDNFQEGMIRTLRAETISDWIFWILGICVGAAVSEELLFRGFLLSGLERRFGAGARS